jgi:hypothetical protein
MMVKQGTTRTAWSLSAILAVALLGGFGVMLTHGFHFGRHRVVLRLTGQWAVFQGVPIHEGFTDSQRFYLGFIILDDEVTVSW